MGLYLFVSAASAAPKPSPIQITRAPEIVDPHQLMNWLNGSVVALIGLNLLALGLFLTSLISPQLKKTMKMITAALENLYELYRERLRAKTQTPESVVTHSPAGFEDKTEVIEAKAPSESLDVVPPPPPPPSPSPESLRETVPAAIEEITEVLAAAMPTAAAPNLQETAAAPVADANAETMIASEPAPPATPASAPIAAPESAPDQTEIAEKQASIPNPPEIAPFNIHLDKTEELPIFDPSMIDEVLEVEDKTGKGPLK